MNGITSQSDAVHSSPLEDEYVGVGVIIAARWLLVAAGLLFVLYRPQSTAELTVGVLSILAVAVTNFWLQMRPLRKEPVEPLWAHCASAADLAVISGLLFMQGDPSGKSFAFYFPAIVAYSLVFPMQVTAILTAAVVSFVCWLSISGTGDMTVVARSLILAAMAFIGRRYQHVEALRLALRSEITAVRLPSLGNSAYLQAQEDIYHGQIVCAAARWFAITAALYLTLFESKSIASMERALIPLLLMIAANFYLHARYMMRLPANSVLLKIASGADVVLISIVIVAGNQEYFILYYPVVFAFSLVFARRLAISFTALVAAAYGAIFVLCGPGIQWNGDEETLAVRLVTLFATALLGAMYWRVQRSHGSWESK